MVEKVFISLGIILLVSLLLLHKVFGIFGKVRYF